MPYPTTVLASKSAAFQVEAAVVGAGVIGLAIGRALAKAGMEVIILDRAGSIGSGALCSGCVQGWYCSCFINVYMYILQTIPACRTLNGGLANVMTRLETSSRNSEVIHAGLYYPSDSRKADFCVQGKHLLYSYCKSRNIPYRNCGKLIVATQKIQLETQQLPSLQQHAIRNGVHDTKILTPEDVSVIEPHVDCAGALWSPSTGVVDSHSFMLSLLADAEDHGATLALYSNLSANRCEEMAGEPPSDIDGNVDDGILLQIDDNTWLQCKTVINSAGLWAHQVARAIHHTNRSSASPSYTVPRQYFAKGNYFRLEGCTNPFHHLVYPLPEPGGLGVHATIDWSGQGVKFGPDVEWVNVAVEDPGDIDLTPRPERSNGFYEQIRKYWPGLPDHALAPDYAGIRPKLHHPSLSSNGDSPFHDFLISTPDHHGIPGLIYLLGMESPGLTSSMAIGDYIAQQVKSWD